MTTDMPSPEQAVKETAAYWAMRLASEDCGPADRAAFTAWRDEHPDHAAAFERTERALRTVDRQMAHPELEAMARQVLVATSPKRSLLTGWLTAGVAASLLLFAGVFSLFTQRAGLASEGAPVTTSLEMYETAVGERSTVTLSDGSIVTLNTNSKVEVDFEDAERKIALVRGQALFEVTKDVSRPFVVKAGNQRITALGTTFDIRFDQQDEVRVVLVEGRVAVDEVDEVREKPVTAKRVEMAAGDTLIASATADWEIVKTNVELVTSWRDGRLVFREEPLEQAVSEINRYSTSKIQLADDPRLKEMTVSGVFNVGKTDSFVLALETMHQIKARKTQAGDITLLWTE